MTYLVSVLRDASAQVLAAADEIERLRGLLRRAPICQSCGAALILGPPCNSCMGDGDILKRPTGEPMHSPAETVSDSRTIVYCDPGNGLPWCREHHYSGEDCPECVTGKLETPDGLGVPT